MPLFSRRRDSYECEPRDGSGIEGTVDLKDRETEPEEVFTVDEAIESIGIGFFQVLILSVAGLIWTVEAFEIMLLAILSAVLKCEWGLTSYEEAAITSFVFVGFLIGSVAWGAFADKYGRKRALILVCATSAIFGILSAFSPNIYWMVFLRMLLGFSAAGGGQGITFCIEFLPSKVRGIGVLLVEVFWVFGAMGIVGIGWTTVPTLGWQWMLVFAALPATAMTLVVPFVPQSPRFLILHGQADKALSVLNLVARINCKPRLHGRLVTVEEKERMQRDGELPDSNSNRQTDERQEDGREADGKDDKPPTRSSTPLIPSNGKSKWGDYFFVFLFKNGMWKTTFLLWLIWLLFVFYYYGIILLTTTIFQYDKHCSAGGTLPVLDVCKTLDDEDYKRLLWTSASEVPGVFVTMLILPFIGRKIVMGAEMLVTTLFTGFLFICADEIVLTVFLFVCRALIAGAFQALYVYTPEVYPTRVRALGLGISSTVGRIGGIISPYIAQVLFPASDIAGIIVFMVIPLASAVAVFLLPIETKGRKLKDTGEAVH